jgi:hypothetical protein
LFFWNYDPINNVSVITDSQNGNIITTSIGYRAIIMNEFDKRQLNIMIQKIHEFEERSLHLSDLIYDLEALVNLLNDQDSHWKDLFVGYWWDLEQVYAVALYKNIPNLDFNDQQTIKDAIENLKKLIKMKLKALNEKSAYENSLK